MMRKAFILLIVPVLFLTLSQCSKDPDYRKITLSDTMESYEQASLDQAFLVDKIWVQVEYRYDDLSKRWNRGGGDGRGSLRLLFQEDGIVKTHYHSDDKGDIGFDPHHYGSHHYSISPESHQLIIDGMGTYVTYPVSDKSFLLRLDNQLFLYSDVTGIMDF